MEALMNIPQKQKETVVKVSLSDLLTDFMLVSLKSFSFFFVVLYYYMYTRNQLTFRFLVVLDLPCLSKQPG